jgi:hypothetical protein
MSNRALGRADDVGVPADSLRHRPDSQPPASGLDPTDEDRVRRLLGDEPFESAVACGPLRLDDLAAGVRRRAEVADLALAYEISEGAECLLDVHQGTRPMYLIQVEIVGAEPLEGVLDRAQDPLPRPAAVVRLVAHGHEELRGQHHLVAAALKCLTEDLLRDAAGVDVGGVDEVDAGVECVVDDADRVGAVLVAPRAEHHRAQAQRADRHPGPSQ